MLNNQSVYRISMKPETTHDNIKYDALHNFEWLVIPDEKRINHFAFIDARSKRQSLTRIRLQSVSELSRRRYREHKVASEHWNYHMDSLWSFQQFQDATIFGKCDKLVFFDLVVPWTGTCSFIGQTFEVTNRVTNTIAEDWIFEKIGGHGQ